MLFLLIFLLLFIQCLYVYFQSRFFLIIYRSLSGSIYFYLFSISSVFLLCLLAMMVFSFYLLTFFGFFYRD